MRPLHLRATDALSDCGRSCSVSTELSDEISAALERARVVGVLDAYQERTGHSLITHVRPSDSKEFPQCCAVGLAHQSVDWSRGLMKITTSASLDAARAVAAKAIEAGEV